MINDVVHNHDVERFLLGGQLLEKLIRGRNFTSKTEQFDRLLERGKIPSTASACLRIDTDYVFGTVQGSPNCPRPTPAAYLQDVRTSERYTIKQELSACFVSGSVRIENSSRCPFQLIIAIINHGHVIPSVLLQTSAVNRALRP